MHGTNEASDSRRDMLAHQNEHVARDFLTFHTSQPQNRRFPTKFLRNRPQNGRFVRGFRRFSSHVTKCRPCHGICALSPLRATLTQTMWFAKKTQHDTSKVLRLPRKMTWEVFKVLGGLQGAVPATKNATHFLKTWQKYCACHTKPLLTRHETCWNVTKCHACDAKWSYATLESPKSDPFCRT